MVLTLAFWNLFHDRIRLIVTLIGILFSIVLGTVLSLRSHLLCVVIITIGILFYQRHIKA